jgi:SAM-dependent methyltransferase
MWMGGVPPLGYRCRDHKLIVIPREAETVQHIFRRYAALGSVRLLQQELDAAGVRSKSWVSTAGRCWGGKPLARGALYTMLRNRIYRGQIVHKDQHYPGEHEPPQGASPSVRIPRPPLPPRGVAFHNTPRVAVQSDECAGLAGDPASLLTCGTTRGATTSEARLMRTDQQAAQTWNRQETLDETNARIHDGADGDEALARRGSSYVNNLLFANFPVAVPSLGADILEVGSGVGWIMQAMNGYLSDCGRAPKRIIGLDIAPNMSAKARQRLGEQPPYQYMIYDGITVPLSNASLDLIYSVACLQHIPRPYVFNLFFEIRRLLRPNGFAVLHFLSTDHLLAQERMQPWRAEISNQLTGQEAHWHHFYTAKELADVLMITGFPSVAVADDGAGTLVVCMALDPAAKMPKFRSKTEILEGELIDLRARAAGQVEEIERLQKRADVQARKVECMQKQTDDVLAEAAQHKNQAAALSEDSRAIQVSRSWKITAPLRRIATVIREGR